MVARKIENNKVTLGGTITSELTYSHEVFGEKFYMAKVSTERTSGVADVISAMISERLVDVKENLIGREVAIDGQFRSFNSHDGDKNRLELFVFAQEVFLCDEGAGFVEPTNNISLDGYICKTPVYRRMTLGRNITDVLVAVNRGHGKSDYIPCICWGRNANYVATLEIGTHVMLEGRIQSREYTKRISETEVEQRVAYEVSASSIYTI